MSAIPRPFAQVRVRRRVALGMAIAILLAGVAQAAHYHKDEQGNFGGADPHCLLCQYAGGTAAPPVPLTVPAAPPLCRDYRPPHSIPCPEGYLAASYDARGPPAA